MKFSHILMASMLVVSSSFAITTAEIDQKYASLKAEMTKIQTSLKINEDRYKVLNTTYESCMRNAKNTASKYLPVTTTTAGSSTINSSTNSEYQSILFNEQRKCKTTLEQTKIPLVNEINTLNTKLKTLTLDLQKLEVAKKELLAAQAKELAAYKAKQALTIKKEYESALAVAKTRMDNRNKCISSPNTTTIDAVNKCMLIK